MKGPKTTTNILTHPGKDLNVIVESGHFALFIRMNQGNLTGESVVAAILPSHMEVS